MAKSWNRQSHVSDCSQGCCCGACSNMADAAATPTNPPPPAAAGAAAASTLQDTLYEYIKGLQDAVKLPDPDLAQRLLYEIRAALTLPTAVSLIVSANGARLIASCVKHFRYCTLKPASRGARSAMEEVSSTPALPPVASNESRRKRQRTVGDAEDDEDLVVVATSYHGRESFSTSATFSEHCPKPVRVKTRSLKVRGKGGVVTESTCSSSSGGAGVSTEEEVDRTEVTVVEKPVVEKPVGDVSSISQGEENTGGPEEEADGVYKLAKASGMSNVVATACSALDKLLTAALQAKGVKCKAGNAGNGKRGKALSAEMYVALTEAFVDMVHVLKDKVELLSWCLNCLGSILPPGSLERASLETSSAVAPVKDAVAVGDEDGTKVDGSEVMQQLPAAVVDQQLVDQKLFPSKALLKLATKYRESTDFTLKIGSKTASGGSYVAAARTLTSGKSNKGLLQSAFCGGITSESTSSSISALAAVAYAATVPMLAEKAVKAVLSAMQSCDIESRSTMAALRALSAHLSSTNSKSTCDDAFAFVIAAMREFLSDPEMQAESCLALGSLIRAVSSTTGHAAWTAITVSMDRHRDNLTVQRAGCGALQILCTRTGLGIPEWRTGKRPLRASKDSDRDTGARALIHSMSSFPNDVRIQWHGCSTLWTLVHSAGVKSVANMVKFGAVSAVVGAMSVCRMNEMMQQEGCNVIGTMVRTLAENGHEIGLFLSPIKVDDEQDAEKTGLRATDWWTALGAVVSAMKMFSKSKSLQSNGTFALGCILKGSGETASFGSTGTDAEKQVSGNDARQGTEAGDSLRLTFQLLGKDIVDNAERISAAVEATMIAMREFSKVETVQVWGCAVLQQAFLAYVHYAKCLGPVSEACSSSSGLQSRLFSSQKTKDPESKSGDSKASVPSPSESFAKFILSQATSAMYMISRTMALSYTTGTANATSDSQAKVNSSTPARTKPTVCSRSQSSTSSLFFSSVRQSWCAALGAIGDVFGYLTRNSEVPIGKTGLVNSDCMDFFRSNKSFFDRSSTDQSLHASCCDDDRSDSEDGAQSEKSSLDTAKDSHDDEKVRRSDCSSASWIDWTGFGASTQQAVKDIKAWQEATESMSKIAEDVGFPLSVKNAILSIRTIFYKLEDAETVIWACHALVSLYLTWESLHLFKPGTEVDREEYKAKIWGEGEAGVRQLVDLVVYWSNQNRLDVTSLALQALYGACVFAATVQEIEKVFALGSCGAEAVLGALQKALLNGSAQHRRKVVQQACCVLATVCGYSIRAQVAVAVHGGADLILTALDRYNEDNQIQVNGLHALGIDSHAQPDFDAVWNAAISKSAPAGKSSRRKRGNQTASSVVSLAHIFREGINCPAFRDTLSVEEGSSCLKGTWNPCFQRLVLHGAAPIGLFRTAVLAAPGCGGPAFAMELLRRLFDNSLNAAELQAHVCFVIGYMAEHNPVLRASFIDAGAMESVLACMSAVYSWKRTFFSSFGLLNESVEVDIQADADADADADRVSADDKCLSDDATLNGVDLRIQCAAAWAVAGLAKNQSTVVDATLRSVVQALAVALHRYGGLLPMPPYGLRLKKSQLEVCVPARLALARLGVFRLTANSQNVFLVHEAAETGDLLCLKALVEAGVDVLVNDADGKNGEWHAEFYGQAQAAQILKEQVQLQGRRKAREKAKAKSKQNNRKKGNLVVRQEQEQDLEQEPEPEHEQEQDVTVAASVALGAGPETLPPPVSNMESVVAQLECLTTNDPAPEASSTFEEMDRSKGTQRALRNNKKKLEKALKNQNTEPLDWRPPLSESSFKLGCRGEESRAVIDGSALEKQGIVNRLNSALREAMASGEVEKMESALKACEEGGQAVDERLFKQVKGALAKRLKRREKASVLEEELHAAIEEGAYSRLHAAVVAVEQSSRFASTLQEKLQVAKGLLLDMESESQVTSEQQPDAPKPELIEEDECDQQPWIVLQKGRKLQQPQQQQKDKENVESAPENVRPRRDKASRSRRAKNNNNRPQSVAMPPPANRSVSIAAAAATPPASAIQNCAAEAAVVQRDLPPLLPTPPRSTAATSMCSSGQARSVIMPPKSAAAAASTSSCEHNPITPQLFPANRSPLVCNTDLGDYYSNDYGGVSQLSLLLSSSWSSPRSCSSLDDSRWGGSWPAASSRCSTPVEEHSSTFAGFDPPQHHHQQQQQQQQKSAGGEVQGGYVSALLARLFPADNLAGGGLGGSGSLFWEENPRRRMGRMMGVSEAALVEAAMMEESCCICYEEPKDAALVPCGHRMCKQCAQQMRCVRLNCPLCNRYIDAVLALYG